MLHFRFANVSDLDLYYEWANDPEVRANSYDQGIIWYEDHVKWFRSRLEKENTFFYLFLDEKEKPVGQVRIEKAASENVLGISIDKNFRGKGSGAMMLQMACDDFVSRFPGEKVTAYVKKDNIASYRIFIKAGFTPLEEVNVHNAPSYKLILHS